MSDQVPASSTDQWAERVRAVVDEAHAEDWGGEHREGFCKACADAYIVAQHAVQPGRSNTDYSVYVRDLGRPGVVTWLNTYGTIEAARGASMIPRYEIDHIEKVTTTREIVR